MRKILNLNGRPISRPPFGLEHGLHQLLELSVLAWFGLPERDLLSAASVLSFGLANGFLTNLQRK